MQRIVHFIFVVITLSSFWTQAQTPTPPSTDRSGRVEEILVWKISEELKLAPQEEKKVSDLIRGPSTENVDWSFPQRKQNAFAHLSKIAHRIQSDFD